VQASQSAVIVHFVCFYFLQRSHTQHFHFVQIMCVVCFPCLIPFRALYKPFKRCSSRFFGGTLRVAHSSKTPPALWRCHGFTFARTQDILYYLFVFACWPPQKTRSLPPAVVHPATNVNRSAAGSLSLAPRLGGIANIVFIINICTATTAAVALFFIPPPPPSPPPLWGVGVSGSSSFDGNLFLTA